MWASRGSPVVLLPVRSRSGGHWGESRCPDQERYTYLIFFSFLTSLYIYYLTPLFVAYLISPKKFYCTFDVVALTYILIYFVPTLKEWKSEWVTLIIRVELKKGVTRSQTLYGHESTSCVPKLPECRWVPNLQCMPFFEYVYVSRLNCKVWAKMSVMVPCYLKMCLKISLLSHYFPSLSKERVKLH